MVCSMICLIFFLAIDVKSNPDVSPGTSVAEATPVPTTVLSMQPPALDAQILREEVRELKRFKDAVAPSVLVNPYSTIVLTDEEYTLLAGTAYNEARGEPYAGQVAVVEVILNRYLHPDFKGTIKDIVTAPNQFAYGNKYTDTQMQAVKDALNGYGALDFNIDVIWFSTGGLTYGSLYKTICCHEFRADDTDTQVYR